MMASSPVTSRILLRAVAFLVVFAIGASLLSGYGVAVCLQEAPKYRGPQSSQNRGAFPLLGGFDFDHGEWRAYLLLSSDDFRSLRMDYKRNCLRLTDRATLKRMQRDWHVVCHGADVATVTSRLLLFHDGVLAFDAGIVLDAGASEGFQHRDFGFAVPAVPGTIRKYAKAFTPIYWPVVVL